jgi:ferredoxin-NADP reductase
VEATTTAAHAPSGVPRWTVSAWLPARVVRVEPATPHGRVLFLDVPAWPGNFAGQHLDIRLTAEDGYQAQRSYSLASSGPGGILEIAVDELPDGEVSPYLVEDVQPGDELEVRGPIGAFFVWMPTQLEPVQLIAGGSGVVPLVSIARARIASANGAPFRMLYSVRSPEDAFYGAELGAIDDPAFRVDWIYTRRAPAGWPHPVGRISAEAVRRDAIPPADDPLVYVCGPTGFVESAAGLLVDLGYDPARIKTERFGGA